MIKSLRFVRRRPELSASQFSSRWPQEQASRLRNLQREVRPLRVSLGIVLRDVPGVSVPWDGIETCWFVDERAAQAFLVAERGEAAHSDRERLEQEERVVIAEEAVLRGEAWLRGRWGDGIKFKHMALAKRAAGLSQEEFSRRWRGKQGKVGGQSAAPPIAIPDVAKGLAYIQNHPLTGAGDGAYDAVNEVYFDDLDAMRARIDFFRDNRVGQSEADLVREATFVAVQEQVL